jgi:RNA polymerase sigma-70 factor (ECF subfamily)
MSDCIDCHKENIENNLDNKILRIKINEILGKMNIKYKEVLILKFIEDKEYKEISDIIKKPINTVGTLINRAKKQFKELYGQK